MSKSTESRDRWMSAAAPLSRTGGFDASGADESIAGLRGIRLIAPTSADQLHSYIRTALGFDVPRRAVVPGNDAPFDYLRHSFFEEGPNRDCIVWANRGGGKTQLAAIATLLDLLFKPGIQIRILGGSFEQSSRMYAYLKRMLANDVYSDLIDGSLTGRYVELINGSRVEVLSQSECSIRGQRVHRLRCDEVDLFEPEIWQAAQLVTRSGRCGDVHVRAGIEALSTMHQPFGLMQQLVQEARTGTSPSAGRRIFRWSLLDSIEHCPPSRSCQACPLWSDCGGRAKSPQTRGFISIDDAIQQKHRVGAETWAAEMLCERPTRTALVYPEFDPRLHVFDPICVGYSHDFPQNSPFDPARRGIHPTSVRYSHSELSTQKSLWIGGIDFGYRAPTVLLWACVDSDGVVHIMDELVQRLHTTQQLIELASRTETQRGYPRPRWIGADPAGHQRGEHTGVSSIALWRRAGWTIRTRAMRIEPGIQAVKARLLRADGSVGLRIHARCKSLIESLSMYH